MENFKKYREKKGGKKRTLDKIKGGVGDKELTKLGIVTPKEERGKKATTEKVTNMLCKCDNYALSIIIILYN